ncbi:carboxyltransferase domain-containing protein [Alphaproteobacteria bacterium]|nr:carboxyltransferase domain-containing protein [Alphaproteobacteria bacterium]
MVKAYSQKDLDNFEKIKLSEQKISQPIKDKPYRYDTKLLDKSITKKKKQNYDEKDKNQFSLIENSLSVSQGDKEPKYFFSQSNIDDSSGYRVMYPHNIRYGKSKIKRPSIKVHINEDGSLPKLNWDNDTDLKSEIFKGMYDEPKYLPGGDKYLLVEFGNIMSLELNFKAQGLAKAIEQANIKGIYETLPCFASMIVHYNSDEIKYGDLKKELKSLVGNLKSSDDTIVKSRLFKFPTVYLDKWTKEAVEDYTAKITYKKPDPEFIVELNNLDNVDHFVRVHSSTEYWVASLGFWPGLPFTMPLDPRCKLTAPKYNPPRTWTPKGAVGMGGSSTAIYPDKLPGGYQIFGRTPVPIWDSEKRFSIFKDSVCLFRPGDRIKFEPCDYEEFESIERKIIDGSYQYDVMENHKFSIKDYKNWVTKLDWKKKF